jgi:purine-binding chemotaxis protein CheW
VDDGGTPKSLCILCRIGASICAVPIEHVSETMRPLPVEPLAGTPPFVLGVAVLRGAPTPVVDGAMLLGGGSATAGRFLAIRIGERRALIAVDAVLGVRALSLEEIRALPPLLRGPGLEAVDGMGSLDGDLLVVLGAARVIPESVWASLERVGASVGETVGETVGASA